MRTNTAVATIAVLLGSLSACAAPADSSTDSKPEKPASTKADNHSVDETAYLLATRNKVPALENVPDDTLITFGRTSCDAIDAGNSPTAVALKAEEGLKIGEVNSAYLVGAAVSTFCPAHKDEL